MDAKPDTDVEPEADVEEVEWHGDIENPSVGGNSVAAGSERGADGLDAPVPPVPPLQLFRFGENRSSAGGEGEGKEGTAASPMEISSSSDSPGVNFSGEGETTESEGKNSGDDGENNGENGEAEEEPGHTVSVRLFSYYDVESKVPMPEVSVVVLPPLLYRVVDGTLTLRGGIFLTENKQDI